MTEALFHKDESGRIVVKPSIIYPHYMRILGYESADQGKLETARLVFTEDLKQTLGVPLHIYIEKDEGYKLTNFPVGEAPKRAIGAFYKSIPGTPSSRLGLI